jgi:pimeloyl-ACP methyl ester carboxylesterase
MPPPEEGYVDTGELRLHYIEWPGEGPPPDGGPSGPAVLLHATGFLARLWQPIAEGLSGRFHVYAYDARGHGDSDKPANGYGWPGIAADLRGFLDVLGLRSVLAVGHSSGAAGVAYLAATEPGYVSTAVLIEPTVFPPDAPGAEERRQALASGAAKRRTVWPSRDELLRNYRQRRAFAAWRDDVLRLYAEHGTFQREDGQVALKCPGEIEAELYRRSLSTETWGLLPRIACPTLVLRGADTEPLLGTVAQGVARRVPGARLVTIAGGGHFLPMERPDAVLAEVIAFLDRGASPK